MNSVEIILKLGREILKKGKSIRFQVRGWSMRPFIRDGDVIFVSPIENSSFKTGDVVLYSTEGNKVIVHRIIKKDKKDGRMTLLVKGDATSGFADKVDVKNVLGKVTAVERDGRKKRIDTKLSHLIGIFIAGVSPFSQWIYPVGSIVKQNGRRILGAILERLQGLKFYSVLAKKFIKEDVTYHIESSDETYFLSQLSRYNQGLELETPTNALNENLKRAEDSYYCVVAERKSRIIGSVTLTDFPEGDSPYEGWWIFGLWVNWRYRGMGIGEKMVKMAVEKEAKDDASEIKLLVFKDAKRAINLYKKLGFHQISIPELDKQLAQEAEKTSRRRIILAKDLKSS